MEIMAFAAGAADSSRNPKQRERVASPLSGRRRQQSSWTNVNEPSPLAARSQRHLARPDFLVSRRLSATCSPRLIPRRPARPLARCLIGVVARPIACASSVFNLIFLLCVCVFFFFYLLLSPNLATVVNKTVIYSRLVRAPLADKIPIRSRTKLAPAALARGSEIQISSPWQALIMYIVTQNQLFMIIRRGYVSGTKTRIPRNFSVLSTN